MEPKILNYFLRINNLSNFIIKDIPILHPKTNQYKAFWKEQYKRIIEGFWSIDDENITIDVSKLEPFNSKELLNNQKWRYMSPYLYFYAQFAKIKHRQKGQSATAAKKLIRPYVRDVEWELSYDLMECNGFSGFELDDEYTCYRKVLDEDFDIEDFKDNIAIDMDGNVVEDIYYNVISRKTSQVKKYIPAKEYIRQIHTKNLGRPLFNNGALGLMLLGTRSLGKSYFMGGLIAHEIIIDGQKVFTFPPKKNISELFVGSGIASKSYDLMLKARDIMNNLPGTWAKGTKEAVPAPFYKSMSGSIHPNNKWIHSYKKKIAGEWRDVGSKSSVTHIPFTTENPEAAAGGRYRYVVCEEVGLTANILAVHACFAKNTKIRMFDGSLKNVQDIKNNDLVLGFDGTKRTVINVFDGIDQMYNIEQKSGITYKVNSKHKLYFEKFNNSKDDGIKTLTAEEYYTSSYNNAKRNVSYGLKSGILNFEKKDLKLHPYFMGLYLGDGIVKSCGVCYNPKTDISTEKWLIEYYKSVGLNYNVRDIISVNLCVPVGLTHKKNNNSIRIALHYYDTYYKKFLHPDFIFTSQEDRLELLAGLIDTDGTLQKGKDNNLAYVFYQSGRPDMVDKIEFIARSLGFRVTTCEHIDKRKAHYKIRQQVTITGDIYKIPCKLERKKVIEKNTSYKRSPIRSSLKVIKSDISEYYGFTLLEDDKFLLSDNTIAYNSNEATLEQDGELFGSPIYLGTGGNIQKIVESEKLFKNPADYKMLSFEDIWKGGKPIGRFIPAIYKDNDLKDKNGNTDIPKAYARYIARRKEKEANNNPRALYMEKMNFPLEPEEMFLSAKGGFFPTMELQRVHGELVADDKRLSTFTNVEFDLMNGLPIARATNKMVITDFPYSNTRGTDAAIEIYEHPINEKGKDQPPYLRYIAGTDPVDDDDVNEDSSLQSTFILDTWTDKIVAEYTSRPTLTDRYYEQLRRLLMYYNAKTNYEADKKGLYAHFKNKNSLYLLLETPKILTEQHILKNVSSVGNKAYGTKATDAVNEFADKRALAWLETSNKTEPEKRNMDLIPSRCLLLELIKYTKDLNVDRVRAFGLLMIYKEDIYKILEQDMSDVASTQASVYNDPMWQKAIQNYKHKRSSIE